MANRILVFDKLAFDPAANQYFQLIFIDNSGSFNLYIKDVPAPTNPGLASAISSSGATPVIAPSCVGQVDGVGTTGNLPLWTDGPNSVIGDSVLTQSAGSLIQPTGSYTLTLGNLVLSAGVITFPSDVRQTFAPGANNPGLNVGSHAGDPITPANGDIWYDSTGNLLRARINGATISITAGTGGTVTSVSVTTANGVSGSVATATTTPAITITLGAITPSSVTASGALQSGTVSVATGSLNLANAASAFLTTIQAGNAAAARTYIWPTNFGAAGSALTDAAGNGTLSWAVPATTTINPTNNVVPQRSSATAFVDSPITGSIPASMVDGITVTGAAAANPATVTVAATGSDTNIFLDLTPKGTGGVRFPFGTAANPGLGFQTTTDRGIFGAASGLWVTIAGNAIAGADATGFYVTSSKLLGASSGVVGTNAIDTSLSRNAAGIWQFGTSSANASGSFLGLITLTVQASTPLSVSTGVSYTTYTNEGAGAQIVFNLPAAAAGLNYRFIVQNANGIQVKANGTNTIRLASAVSTAGGTATSTTIGSSITLVAINATEWMAREIVGTWVTA